MHSRTLALISSLAAAWAILSLPAQGWAQVIVYGEEDEDETREPPPPPPEDEEGYDEWDEPEPEPAPEPAPMPEPEPEPEPEPVPIASETPSGDAVGLASAYPFAFAVDGSLEEQAEEIERTLRDLIAGSTRYSMAGPDERIHGRDPADTEAIQQARETFEAGRASYINLEIEQAVEQFEQALSVFEEHVAHIDDIGLMSDCLMYIGASHALAGSSRTARSAFMRLLTIDPQRRPDPDVFPPDIVSVFDDAARRMGRVRSSSIEIRSDPEGADVFVDGVHHGPAPQTVEGLKEGRHYVRVRLPNYREYGRVVEIGARRASTVEVSLAEADDGPAVQQLIAQLPQQIVERPDDASATVQRLGEILAAEVIFTALVRAGDEGMIVQYAAWDALTGEEIVTTTEGPFSEEGAELIPAVTATVDDLVAAAWAAQNTVQATDDRPARPAPRDPEDGARPARPFWQQWWFWTVVGVAVVGAGLGIGFGAAAASPAAERTNGEVIFDL